MFKDKGKLLFYALLLFLFISMFYVYRFHQTAIWNEEIYLRKMNVPFVEMIKQYDGDDLPITLSDFNNINELPQDVAINLVGKVKKEWQEWVQSLTNMVYAAEFVIPPVNKEYGFNGYFVGSEIQGDLLADLSAISILAYYFDTIEEEITLGTVKSDDLKIIQGMASHFHSIDRVIKDNWIKRVDKLDYEVDMEYIQKIKKPFINSLEPHIKELYELFEQLENDGSLFQEDDSHFHGGYQDIKNKG